MKNKSLKKGLAMLLTAVMMLTVWVFVEPVKADAADTWNGTIPGSATGFANNHITSAAGFVWFVRTVATGTDYNGKTVYLDVDIDLNHVDFGSSVFPYDTGKYFRGTFDGQNKTIFNFKMTDSNHRVAIFRQTEEATFRNVTFTNVTVNSTGDKDGDAVLVGFHNSGNLTFSNVHVTGGSISGGKYVGGLVGEVNENSGRTLTITNCSNGAAITARSGKGAGGLAGYSKPAVAASGCTNTGSVTSSSTDVGGIVGWIEDDASSFIGCTNSGRIQGTESIAGILGYSGGPLTFENCANNSGADITGNKYVGGIIGNMSANSSGDKLILNGCSNAATITCSNVRGGGICGSSLPMLEASGCVNSGNVIGGSTDMGGIAGWIEDDPSSFSDCSNSGKIQGTDSVGGIVGYFGNNSRDQKMTLARNLNTGEIVSTNRAGGIAGLIDTDCNTHSIVGNVNRGTVSAGTDGGGIVAFNKGFGDWQSNYNYGTVVASEDNAGGICGEIEDDSQTFTNCFNYGNVTGKYSTGGIIGYAPKSYQTFKGCKNTGNITSTGGTAAGIYGYGVSENAGGRFEQCENEGDIYSSSGPAGGISGKVGNRDNDPTFYFENCVNRGMITSNGSTDTDSNAGGIAGYINSDATHVFSGCVNYGEVKGKGESGGGIVGKNMGGGTWTGCYNYGTVNECPDNAGGLMGEVEDDTNTFTDCHNFGTVTAGNSAGGIMAFGSTALHNFTNCSNSGAVTSTTDYYAGGIYGHGTNEVNCTECWNTGTVRASKDAGGLVGNVDYHTFYTRCWNAGDVGPYGSNGNDYSYGGLVGYTSYYGANTSEVMVTDCYNWGNITGGNVGGLVGYVKERQTYVILYSYNAGPLFGLRREDQFVGYGSTGCCGTGCYKHVNLGSNGIYKSDQDFIDYNFTIDNNFSKNADGVTINGVTYYYPVLKWCELSMPEDDPAQPVVTAPCTHNDSWSSHYTETDGLYYTCDNCGERLDSECPIGPFYMTNLPSAAGTTLVDGKIYNVSENTTITATAAKNGLIVPSGGCVVINIAAGKTLTVNGGSADGETPGKAGILVNGTSKLIITGSGSLVVKAGNGGNGSNGTDGNNNSNGGWGGKGGSGGGAAIGGNGANGGAGGDAGDNGSGRNWNGGNGSPGDNGGNAGKIYIMSTVSITATDGSDGVGGAGGAGGSDTDGGGGGGGGGRGKGGYAIGGGGAGGGGGGGGGAGDGGLWWKDQGKGGYGGEEGGQRGANSGGSKYNPGSGGSSGQNGGVIDYSDSITGSDPRVASALAKFVFLNKQDGNNEPDIVRCSVNCAMPSITVPTRRGYTFLGYYTRKNGEGTMYYDGDGNPTRVADFETGELYAHWSIDAVPVSANFWRIAGTVSVAETVTGDLENGHATVAVTATQPPKTVTYENKTLTWYGFTTEYTAGPDTSYSTLLTRDISGGENFNSLYSGVVTLSFNGNGGSYSPPSQTARQYVNANENGIVGEGSTFTLSATVPVKTGFTFLGWARDANATAGEFDPGSVISDVRGNTTLYAVWQPIVYYVKYHPNGGSGSMDNTTHYYGVPSPLSPSQFSLSYTVTYNFGDGRDNESDTAVAESDGWASTASGNLAYAPEQNVTNLGKANGVTVTIYAHWLKGSVRLPTPTRYGYTFSGWYTNASCTDLAGGGGDSYTPNSNTTLYAKWEPKSYTVSYDGNGANGGSTTASRHVYDTASALSANGFIRDYTVDFVYNGATSGERPATMTASSIFGGWALSADGPAIYADKENVLNLAESGVVQLFAKWRNGSIVLPTPEKTNRVFDGWYYDEDLSQRAGSAGTDLTIGENVTLYAKWTDVADPVLVKAPGSSTVIDEETGFIYGLPDRDVSSASDIVASNFANITGGAGYVTYEYSNDENVIGTGTKVFLYRSDGVLMKTYTIVIFGDNDGDGYITMADATDATYYDALLDSTYDYEDMSIANVKAMDLNADGMVDQRDISIVIYYAALLIDEVDQTGAGTQV